MTLSRFAAWASALAVAAAVIAGFVLSGTPAEQRLQRLDAHRVSDLQQLTKSIDGYWNERGVLPEELHRVVDGRRLLRMPSDPVTGLSYPYEPLPPAGYVLCATFDLASEPSELAQFWSHSAGQHCYQFEVSGNVSRDRGPQQ
jgi:hypothetical protein